MHTAASLQTRLILAFAAVTLVALFVAGAAFVVIRRGDQEQQALDRVALSSARIQAGVVALQLNGADPRQIAAYLERSADEFDVRNLLVDREDRTVVADTGDELVGEVLTLPNEAASHGGRPRFSRVGIDGSRRIGGNLVTVFGDGSAPGFETGGVDVPYGAVVAVPEDTFKRAWTDLLPGLGIAAAIALPVSFALAIAVARYITRPLDQLTAASLQLADGRFDVDVPSNRRDEFGRLASAFETMAGRVGTANAEMRTLVANVSHDMKTPLTSILGFSQALRDGAVADADGPRMGGVIHEEASRLSDRLADLLYLSELESGNTVVQRVPLDLGDLVRSVADRLSPGITATGLTLAVDAPSGSTVTADAPKLERALENLLDNARKFTPAGGVVSVALTASQGSARLIFANANPGLTAEELPRLFERFYRRDRSRAPGGPAGSGLGLAIARDLVVLNGGTLHAELAGDQLAFVLTLPVAAS